jgi:hypothetical protein
MSGDSQTSSRVVIVGPGRGEQRGMGIRHGGGLGVEPNFCVSLEARVYWIRVCQCGASNPAEMGVANSNRSALQ